MSDDERAIRDLIATWMSASQAGDTDTVLSLMTDDVVFMVPGREPFGKAAFAAAVAGHEGRAHGGQQRHPRAAGAGRLGLPAQPPADRGDATPAGNAIRRAGYTLTILRKEPDGQWRLARDANLLTPQT